MPETRTLMGQNFRVYTYNTTAMKYQVIGMATSCTVTLQNNTESAATKDDEGIADKPVTASQSWNVSVDSFDMSDVGSLLSAMKKRTKLLVAWGESQEIDNQTLNTAGYGAQGYAYLSDCTFNFDNRTNSQKQIQFSGASQLEDLSNEETSLFESGAYTKGQFVRLYLSDDDETTPTAVIAAALSLSLHVSMTLEDATSKDTIGKFLIQEPTALNYDISTSALVRSGEEIESQVGGNSIGDITGIYMAGTPVKWLIANASGDNNRTKGSVICSGSAIITNLQISAAVRNKATYSAQLTGYGEYIVGA